MRSGRGKRSEVLLFFLYFGVGLLVVDFLVFFFRVFVDCFCQVWVFYFFVVFMCDKLGGGGRVCFVKCLVLVYVWSFVVFVLEVEQVVKSDGIGEENLEFRLQVVVGCYIDNLVFGDQYQFRFGVFSMWQLFFVFYVLFIKNIL